MEVKEFCLDNVQGLVHTTCKVTLPPFGIVSVHGNTTVRGHCIWVHVLTELTPGPQLHTGSGANCDLWRVTSGVLLGTHLSVQLECFLYRNPHKNGGWPGCACQPSATGSPPNRDFGGVHQQPLQRMDLGGPGPPKPGGMAQT